MKERTLKFGFTLIEMMVVVAIVALLAVFGMPAVRTLLNSFHSEGNTRAMINSALCCARSIAVKNHTAAGIRFQYVYNLRDRDDILAMPQYMVFIIHDFDATQLAPGFRAVEGMEPIKLPDLVGVMDLRIRTNWSTETDPNDESIATHNDRINDPRELRDTTTFSIIFSSSGRLLMEDVRVWNKDGATGNGSHDDIFNTQTNVENNNNRGMFYQDDYAGLGLGQERGRNTFIIYDTNILKKTDTGNRWNGYLSNLPIIFINPYAGTIINE